MAGLNKVKGEKANCPTCGNQIICVEKEASANFPAKLQWQNPDGHAHYNYNFKKAEGDPDRFSCNEYDEGGIPVDSKVDEPAQTKVDEPAQTKVDEPAKVENKPGDPTLAIIARQNELFDKIQSETTQHMTMKYPAGYNDANMGMRIKEIYRHLSG